MRTRSRITGLLATVAMGASVLVAAGPAGSAGAIDNSIPWRPIPKIQGRGHISPFVGEEVRFDGVITAVAFNGFYVQDNEGDGDNRTSDGIFVSTFRSNFDLDDLKPLRKVRVTGTVSEFIPGGAATGNLSITNIIGADVLQFRRGGRFVREWVTPEKLGGPNGRIMPKDIVISDDELPVNMQFENPSRFDPFMDGIDFYESIEGMLVRANDPQVTGATRRFNPFSAEAVAVLDGGDAVSPADALTARGGIALQADPDNLGDQNPERVQIQFDGTLYPGDVPLLNVGDQLDDVWGVVGYSFGNYEVNAIREVRVTSPGGLTAETTSLTAGDDQLTIGSYNVLNLDPGDGDRFDIVGGHIAHNMASPDIVALQEIQDNNGTQDDDVLDADMTLTMLVDAIAAAGGPTYEWVDAPPPVPNEFGGAPGGNIRNAFLYNADRVAAIDVQSLDVDAFPTGSRDPLIGTFDFGGNEVIVANNHFTSRFGSTPIFGGPQPFVQAGEAERAAQSQAMNDLVDGILAENPDAYVAVVGDLNTFEFADELTEVLPGPEPVLTNLVTERPDDSDDDASYTFIFEGNSQVLDHIFVTDALLAADAEFDIVHTNVDFARDLGDATTGSDHEPMVARFTIPEAPFTLQVLHASDLEGGVDALDRAANFAAIVDAIEDTDDADASITLSAGDNYISGPFFSASGDRGTFRDGGVFNDVYNTHFGLDPADGYAGLREGGGRVDVSIMNVIGFDASAVGNHEFDLGSDAFESIIEEDFRGPGLGDDRWVGSQFPYLSANFDFSADGDLGNLFTTELLPASAFATGPAQSDAEASDTPKIAPATLVQAGRETIGVVGATTPLLATISSPGDTTSIGPVSNDMAALAAVLQPTIDGITAAGVDKIVLVSHLQQIALEEELIGLLSGVDIVIAGGSDTLLADEDDVLRDGDSADRTYPLLSNNADGDPAAIVSTDGEYSYVGRLVVTFDADGTLDPTSIDSALNGPIASTDDNVAAQWGGDDAFATGSKGELVRRMVEAARGVVIAKDGNIVGETAVFIEGRRSEVRTQETNLGNLSADANLAAAQLADPSVVVSIKNGGGIRAEIGEIVNDGDTTSFLPPSENPLVDGDKDGDVSQLDLENSLRFNNALTLLTATATELKATIEHGVAATGPGNTPGQFAQVGGMRFSYDASQDPGSRVQSLEIVAADGTVSDVVVAGGAIVGDPNRTFRLVTLSFLAGGGDGYPFADYVAPDVRQLAGDAAADGGLFDFADSGTEQDALAEFFGANHGVGAGTPFSDADTPADLDQRIVDVTPV